MASWMKKLDKVSRGDLNPGEELIAAVFLQPMGTMTKAVGQGVGGLIGKAVASKMGGSANATATAELVTDSGIGSTFDDQPSVIGLTHQRVLVYSYGAMGGKPKDLKMWIAAMDLVSVDVEQQKATYRVVLHFRDGSAKVFEAPRVKNDPAGFATAVNSR